MRGINALVVWMGVIAFAGAGLLLLFYAATILLPLILIFFAVSIVIGWFKKNRHFAQQSENAKFYYRDGKTASQSEICKKQPNIIDAEYEIVDDKDSKK